MSDDLTNDIAATVAKQKVEDAAGRTAAATPLPGPTRKAFSLSPEIDVLGKYKVRSLCVGDVELLAQIDHPLVAQVCGDGNEFNYPHVIGQVAFEVAWLLTRPRKLVRDLIRDKGTQAFKDAAFEEFGDCGLAEMSALFSAVTEQIIQFWSTVIGYGANTPEGGEAAKAPANPTLSAVP